jgi:hypothetical protein
VLRNPAHRSGVNIYGAVTQSLQLQGTQVLLVQRVESDLLAGFHGKLLHYQARNWARMFIHEFRFFLPRSGFVQQGKAVGRLRRPLLDSLCNSNFRPCEWIPI